MVGAVEIGSTKSDTAIIKEATAIIAFFIEISLQSLRTT
jgi:hypothetical protein